MIIKKKKLVQNYTDSDLHSFENLKNFSNYIIDQTEVNNKNHLNRIERYTISDNKKFKQLMNIDQNINIYSKKYSDYTKNYDDFKSEKKLEYNNFFYKDLDIKNFEKIQNFPITNSSNSIKNTNQIKDYEINYTSSDLESFDRILGFNENNINNKSTKTLNEKNNFNSNIDKKQIRIVDFDKLKKREKIYEKFRDRKIKVVYFD